LKDERPHPDALNRSLDLNPKMFANNEIP
jgi:hypothetical protein